MSKIALVAPYKQYNYGTVLQAYALQRKIEEQGIDVEYLQYTRNITPIWKRPLLLIRDVFRSFVPKRPVYTARGLDDYSFFRLPEFSPFVKGFEHFIKDRIKMSKILYNPVSLKNCREYDAYMVGSDQTWGSMRLRPRNPYFLDPVSDKYPKLSYAPSIGTTHIPQDFLDTLTVKLARFKALSCREKSNCDLLKDKLGRDVAYVLDPTMLLKAEDWDRIAGPVRDENIDQKYILCYILGEKECISNFAETLGKRKNLPVIYIVTRPKYLKKENHLFATPESFLSLIRSADTVVTDSFHGTAFSLNYNVQFYSFAKREDVGDVNDNDRVLEFLHTLNLDNRFKQDDDLSCEEENIDYSEVNRVLEDYRRSSNNYLYNTIGFLKN